MTRDAHLRTARRWLVLSASLLVAAACTGNAADGTSTTTAIAETTSASASSSDPTLTSVSGSVIGGGSYPSFTVQAPSGWSTADGYFVINHTGGVLGLGVYDVGRVPRNPCHWQETMLHPGPTVDDLVSALVAQKMRNATPPTDVTLDGYGGQYIEWSVPADMVVHGDADFKGCDVQPSNGHLDFVSWFGNGMGERYQQVAGQVDRLWILNVSGQRLLVDASYSPDTTQANRTELMNVAESLRFTKPAA